MEIKTNDNLQRTSSRLAVKEKKDYACIATDGGKKRRRTSSATSCDPPLSSDTINNDVLHSNQSTSVQQTSPEHKLSDPDPDEDEVFCHVAAQVSESFLAIIGNNYRAELSQIANECETLVEETCGMTVLHGCWSSLSETKEKLTQFIDWKRGRCKKDCESGELDQTRSGQKYTHGQTDEIDLTSSRLKKGDKKSESGQLPDHSDNDEGNHSNNSETETTDHTTHLAEGCDEDGYSCETYHESDVDDMDYLSSPLGQQNEDSSNPIENKGMKTDSTQTELQETPVVSEDKELSEPVENATAEAKTIDTAKGSCDPIEKKGMKTDSTQTELQETPVVSKDKELSDPVENATAEAKTIDTAKGSCNPIEKKGMKTDFTQTELQETPVVSKSKEVSESVEDATAEAKTIDTAKGSCNPTEKKGMKTDSTQTEQETPVVSEDKELSEPVEDATAEGKTIDTAEGGDINIIMNTAEAKTTDVAESSKTDTKIEAVEAATNGTADSDEMGTEISGVQNNQESEGIVHSSEGENEDDCVETERIGSHSHCENEKTSHSMNHHQTSSEDTGMNNESSPDKKEEMEVGASHHHPSVDNCRNDGENKEAVHSSSTQEELCISSDTGALINHDQSDSDNDNDGLEILPMEEPEEETTPNQNQDTKVKCTGHAAEETSEERGMQEPKKRPTPSKNVDKNEGQVASSAENKDTTETESGISKTDTVPTTAPVDDCPLQDNLAVASLSDYTSVPAFYSLDSPWGRSTNNSTANNLSNNSMQDDETNTWDLATILNCLPLINSTPRPKRKAFMDDTCVKSERVEKAKLDISADDGSIKKIRSNEKISKMIPQKTVQNNYNKPHSCKQNEDHMADTPKNQNRSPPKKILPLISEDVPSQSPGSVQVSYATRHRCEVCGWKFSTLKHLKYHMCTHNIRHTSLVCDLCGDSFTSQAELTTHIRNHVGCKLFTCCDCSKKCASLRQLTEHRLCHTENKLYNCSVCNRQYPTMPGLKQHMTSHEEMNDVCNKTKTSSSPSAVNDDSVDTKPYICTTCDRAFSREKHLRRHMEDHADNPYPCQDCPRSFLNPHKLKKHRKKHHTEKSIEKPFICSYCDKNVSTRDSLRKHVERNHLWRTTKLY